MLVLRQYCVVGADGLWNRRVNPFIAGADGLWNRRVNPFIVGADGVSPFIVAYYPLHPYFSVVATVPLTPVPLYPAYNYPAEFLC